MLETVYPPFAWAQGSITISGYVRDRASGEALIGATVQVAGTSVGVATNAYGFYALSLTPGRYSLSIMYVGYKPLSITKDVAANETLQVELEENSEELDEIVISAEGGNSNVVSTQMSIAKLDPKLVKQIPAVLGEPDLIRALQLLPGVTAVADGAAGFNVRGGSADQNLILLDEATVYNSSHLLGLFSVANPDAIKSVTLYKGGIPARYGGRLSSVMDIRQREGNSKEFNGEAGIGLISARLLAEGPIVKDKSSFMVAGRRSYGDLFLPLIDNKSTAYFYDLNAKVNYNINERNQLFLSGYIGRDQFSLGSIFNSTWGNTAATLRWNHLFSQKLFANFSAVYSNYDYSLDQLTTGAQYNWISRIISRDAKADFSYNLGTKTHLAFGGEWKNYEFRPGDITPIKGSPVKPRTLDNKYAIETGAYFSIEHVMGPVTINAGIRHSSFARKGPQTLPVYENNQPVVYNVQIGRYENGVVVGSTSRTSSQRINTYNNWEPRLALTAITSSSSSIKASYNRMYQYLHLISNTTAPQPTDLWVPSGNFIEPQMVDQYAIGFFKNLNGNKYEASIEGFYKDMNNLVDYVDGADLITNNTIETELLRGIGRGYGLEFLIRKKNGPLTGWVSYTLSKAERRVKGITESDPGINGGQWYNANFDKPHNLSVVGSYQINKRWSLSSNFVITSGIPGTFPVGRYEYAGLVVPQFGFRNQERLPTYHRLDVSATVKGKKKRWKNGGHEWVFGVYNLYNRANATSIYFTEDAENPGNVKAFKSYLFGILPSVTYNFKF
ncbi:MAG: carboxypeptidase-like regulatory domain-containing protein [Cytophagales bacterium]|nr:carboxypeptidase-like regulatory domain-containing protein [Cytophagales bacterium]MCA6367535.1 carboxypeptidase-like regulatory domain-containing protein [Cytophagales bacterium]MCA6373567.1 carboxypeptidase-like regulatory domain-containing protein [Cytophagales bacterium]MCA6376719.1 carboxypeptidase-like regulatory domain-containing protein [Cytophagales bacterium]MCA6382964.1 carboxypeptidase-like regulatory domain-containing protein [Cytophagales bacterium]